MNAQVDRARRDGLSYLQTAQQSDGRFDTFWSPARWPWQPSNPYRTVFLPALILGALGRIDSAQGIRSRLAAWLLKQHGPDWSFNYWAVDAPERAHMAYPDDLDDTFCALIGLYMHDPKLLDATALGKAVRLLLATENAVGGPYRTWLMPDSAPAVWRDVDLAVNSNVACFLNLIAQPLPNLTALMDRAITRRTYTSPYYPSVYPLLYYLGRAYRGEHRAELAKQILDLRKPAGHWGTPLQTALMLSALDELGDATPQDAAVSYLLRAQQSDGSWPAEPFWLEVKKTYSGSPALSTAFALEALERMAPENHPSMQPTHTDRVAAQLYRQITAEAARQAGELDTTLRAQATATLKRMTAGDHNREILLLPYFFAQSLHHGKPPQSLLRRLGLANLYGWTAYTIYDDLLDAAGDSRMLPLANIMLRRSLQEFQQAVPGATDFQTFVEGVFDAIDAANAWEATHCRFSVFNGQVGVGPLPKYGRLQRLADRSLGHALTPLCVLAALNVGPHDRRAQRLLKSLRHYLIARQLGDDMRDWEQDLRAGQCSYVVAHMLAGLHITPGAYPFDKLIPRMQAEAWEHTLDEVGKLVLQQLALARRELKASQLIAAGSPVAALLDDLEAATNRTMHEQADAKAFLAATRS